MTTVADTKVAQVMTRNVFVLNENSSVDDAAAALINQRIGGAPVLDDAGRLVGVLSKSDLALEMLCGAHTEAWRDAPGRSVTVRDIMATAPVVAHPDDDLRQALRHMMRAKVHRVVVVDGQAIVGILTPIDICRALAPEPAA